MWLSHCVPCLLGEHAQKTDVVLPSEVSCTPAASRTTCGCLSCMLHWGPCSHDFFWSLTSALHAGFASCMSACLAMNGCWRCVQHQVGVWNP